MAKNLKVIKCLGVCSQRRLQYAGCLVYQYVVVGSTSMWSFMLIKYLTDWSDELSNILCTLLTDGSGICTVACVDCHSSLCGCLSLCNISHQTGHSCLFYSISLALNNMMQSKLIPYYSKILRCCLLVHGKCVKCNIGLSFITENDMSFLDKYCSGSWRIMLNDAKFLSYL